MNGSKVLTGVALAAVLGLSGWALTGIHDLDLARERIETRMAIWHTPIGSASLDADGAVFALDQGSHLAGGDPYAQREFAQRAMVRAYNSILARDYDGALKSLRTGLEETGLKCYESKGRLDCR